MLLLYVFFHVHVLRVLNYNLKMDVGGFEDVEQGTIRLHKTRALFLIVLVLFIGCLLSVTVTVTIGTMTGIFCRHSGGNDCDALVAKSEFNTAVKALSAGVPAAPCWDGSSDQAPILWVVMTDSFQDGLPWPVHASGQVCYDSYIIPSSSPYFSIRSSSTGSAPTSEEFEDNPSSV